MAKAKDATNKRLLTETELELMTIIWDIDGGTVGEVIDRLPEHRPLAYTSVSTILRILEKKQVLTSRKDGKQHVYTSKVPRHEYKKRSLKHLLTHVFADAPVSMVKTLLDTDDLTASDLDAIQKIISERLK